jgi:hypothetical protein
VICIYCDSSLLVEEFARAPNQGAPNVALTPEPVSKEDIARIKALVLAGRRDDAIAVYEKAAGVPRAEAAKAVHELMIPTVWAQMRRMPLNAFGFLLYFVLIGASAALAIWAAFVGLESPAFFVLAALAGLTCLRFVVSFGVKLVSTYVASFGLPGRGRVLKRALIGVRLEDRPKDGVTAIVLFEVAPADGSAPFVDEESFLLRAESLDKLAPGNVVPVRFDRARTRVFPVSPIQVLESGPR